MDRIVSKIAGRTFVGVAVLLIGSWIAFAPAKAHALTLEMEYTVASTSPDVLFSVDSTDWPTVSSNLVSYKYFCNGPDYSTATCLSGGGTNGSPFANPFVDGFTASTNQPSGEYYAVYAFYKPNNSFECSVKACFYIKYSWDNTTKIPTIIYANPLNTNTKFTNVVVSGTASTTNFAISYFLDTSEFDQQNQPNTVEVYVSNSDSNQVGSRKKLILPLNDGSSSTTISIVPDNYSGVYATSTYLPDGQYTGWVKFFNFNVNDYVLPTEITTNFTISGGVVTTYTIVSQSDGIFPDEFGYQSQPCGITAIGGCLVNAMALLFYPSANSIDSFTNVYDTLATKFPFAYLTDFRDSITSIYEGSTTASLGLTVPFGTFGDITLISADLVSDVPFTSTIRTILGALIWVMLALQIWRRGQTIFNVKQV